MKIIKFMLLLLILLPSCIDNECKDGNKYIKIINNSDINIGLNENFTAATIYTCTSAPGSFIKANSIDSIFYLANHQKLCWEDVLKNKTITFFIVDNDLWYQYWKHPCDTIRKYVPVLYRYHLKLEDLQRMNWKVVYPPEEESSVTE